MINWLNKKINNYLYKTSVKSEIQSRWLNVVIVFGFVIPALLTILSAFIMW